MKSNLYLPYMGLVNLQNYESGTSCSSGALLTVNAYDSPPPLLSTYGIIWLWMPSPSLDNSPPVS